MTSRRTILSVLSISLIAPDLLFACSCKGITAKEAQEKADVAFSGLVKKVEYLEEDKPTIEPRIIVTLEVIEGWKGPVKKTMVLHTVYNKYSCNGYFFKEGEKFMVFARYNREEKDKDPNAEKTLGISLCGGTRHLANFKAEELGEGKKPE